MKSRKWLLALLIVALLLVDIALGIAYRKGEFDYPDSLLEISVYGAWFAQAALAAAWLAMGGGRLLVRLVASLAILAFIAWLLSSSTNRVMPEWMGWLGFTCMWVFIPLATMRFLGLRVQESGLPLPKNISVDDITGLRSLPNKRRWQYSLGGLFVLSTASAITLGAVSWMKFPSEPSYFLLPFSLFFLGLAFIALCSLWSVWGRRFLAARIAAPLFYCLLISFLLLRLPGASPFWESCFLFGAESATVCLGALVVRQSGYEIVWGKLEQTAEECSLETIDSPTKSTATP